MWVNARERESVLLGMGVCHRVSLHAASRVAKAPKPQTCRDRHFLATCHPSAVPAAAHLCVMSGFTSTRPEASRLRQSG